MLLPDVGLGDVGRDPDRPDAQGLQSAEVLDGPDAGKEEDSDLRPSGRLDRRGDKPLLGEGRSPYWKELPPMPSPWPTSMVRQPAESSPSTMEATWPGVKEWLTACMPSRRVVSMMRGAFTVPSPSRA